MIFRQLQQEEFSGTPHFREKTPGIREKTQGTNSPETVSRQFLLKEISFILHCFLLAA